MYVFLLVYVDDMLLTGESNTNINEVKTFLHKQSTIKDLGSVKYFMGLKVAGNHKGTFLNQKKYILDILDGANQQLLLSPKVPHLLLKMKTCMTILRNTED